MNDCDTRLVGTDGGRSPGPGIQPPVVALVAAMALALSCATQAPTPGALAADRLEQVAELHVADAVYDIRWNPVSCDVPDFEVALDGRHYRVFLEPDEEEGPVAEVRAQLAAAAASGDPLAVARVAGALDDDARLAANRAPCMVLEVQWLCRDSACNPPLP